MDERIIAVNDPRHKAHIVYWAVREFYNMGGRFVFGKDESLSVLYPAQRTDEFAHVVKIFDHFPTELMRQMENFLNMVNCNNLNH